MRLRKFDRSTVIGRRLLGYAWRHAVQGILQPTEWLVGSFRKFGSHHRRQRLGYAWRHAAQGILQPIQWLVSSREFTNFTYNLEPRNEEHLAWWASAVTGAEVTSCRTWLRELAEDDELRASVRSAIQQHAGEAGFDDAVRYSRRAGWYVCVRALKPALVVETGVEKGLGTMVLAAAVRRNKLEGHLGRVVGIDIDPKAGSLLLAPYSEVVSLIISDSLEACADLSDVDFFVHDSDHAADHERREFAIIESRLSPGALVLSDNAHATDELSRFAERTGRRFLFFDERPRDHWYRGAGIGAAFHASS